MLPGNHTMHWRLHARLLISLFESYKVFFLLRLANFNRSY